MPISNIRKGNIVLENTKNGLLNNNIINWSTQNSTKKMTVNKYYNIFSKKLEEMALPDIDLEFNAVLIPEKSTFMRAG